MKKNLDILKRNGALFIIAILLIGALFLTALPINAHAETNNGITSNEVIYKELTNDDQLSGLNITPAPMWKTWTSLGQ